MDAPYRARSRWLASHVLPHEPAIRAWLRRTTQVADSDIDDLIQETYAILAKLDSVEGIRDPRHYAMQVARSVFLQGLRRSKIVSIEAIADLAALEEPDDMPSPEQHVFGQRELRRVEAAIETMPPQVRKVFWLRRVQGLSQRETAHELGLAEHTIEKYAARGMKLLLAQFGRGGNVSPESSRVRDLSSVGPEPTNGRSRTGR
ncbi:sigma-70 family RNA polymerase sigma factor [Sphingomonas sp. AP4-R1]|uniref:RNA polymerase sigma factor n=1 Tax=Sphingomonas sp. AP4-R1 TaxID=2735134 RepID=UPI0014934D8E|nr:sigma-70 family RNA polymerase sigma factor [Sphingomonas sp. AP4-R1]QJU59930.1 sigma-70 family RNA polymerase sigma factor [Sphingomonas sp. AP4-R1]